MTIKLPNLGEGADSGTVASILVAPGDKIEKDQTIIELESEKAVVPVPSTEAGVVSEVLVSTGQQINVGTGLLELEGAPDSGEAKEEKPDESTSSEKKAPAKSESPKRSSRRRAPVEDDFDFLDEVDDSVPMPPASPSVRRAAREIGVDLRRIHGNGAGGRVLMTDLRAFVGWCQKIAFDRSSEATADGVFYPRSAPPSDYEQYGSILKKPVTQLRRVIAERMAENKRIIPHVTQFDDIDVTDLNSMRKEIAPSYKEKGSNLTMTVITLLAVVDALKKHPLFNSSYDELNDEIVLKEYFHIGMAVDTEAGLMVPVIKDADKKSPLELSEDLSRLAKKTRDRQLGPDEMKGGSFTISNQGAIGGGHFTPIVNRPEVAILGVGRSELKPAIVDGEIKARLIMPVSISYDHRLIDGGEAARFSVSLKEAFAAIEANRLKL